jgi:hypothetical protein
MEYVPLLEERPEIAGEGTERQVPPPENHVREPRVDREIGHRLPVGSERAPAVKGAERPKRGSGLREVRRRGRIDKTEAVSTSPPRDVERQRGEVGGKDLRSGKVSKCPMLLLRP